MSISSKTLGRYELICEVAKGQLGPLWVARATGADDAPVVLVRRVSTAAPTTPDEVDTLSEGAWWMLDLQDPRIARGIDVVKTEGELGVVTEYAEGEVLRSLLRLSSFKRKPIPVGIGLRIALDLLEAIEIATEQAEPLSSGQLSFPAGGLVPDSVLVGRDGRARLLDIGILGPATRVGPIARHPEMAAYAPPEQLADANTTDVRSHIYAVGVLLWEMLSGKRLFVGSTHQAVAEKVKAGNVPRLDSSKPVGGDDIPKAVAEVVARAVEGDPAERYDTAKEMADALRAAADVADEKLVGALVDDFAGNTLASRRKLVERAASAPAKPKIDPPKPVIAAAGPPADPKPLPNVAAKSRKMTLIGIPPPAADPLPKPEPPPKPVPPPKPDILAKPEAKIDLVAESLDPAELESISKVEVIPISSSDFPPDELPTTAKDESPKLPPAKPVESPKPSPVITSAGAFPLFGDAPPESAPVSMDLDLISEPPSATTEAIEAGKAPLKLEQKPLPKIDPAPPPKDVPLAEALAKKDSAPDDDDEEGSEPKKKPSDDGSAVAWVGPPPGVPLDDEADDEPVRSVVPERTLKMRKFVALGIGGLAGILALGVVISKLGSSPAAGETKVEAPKTDTAAAKKAEDDKKAEDAKKAEAAKKAEEEKKAAEEKKAEEEKKAAEEKAEEEKKTEEPKPVEKPVVEKPVAVSKPISKPVSKPATTSKPKPTATASKPKPKKPKFTPSGI